MATHISFAEVDIAFHLRSPEGSVAASARELTLERSGRRVDECQLELVLEPDAYRTVDREHLFHLTPEVRGPGSDRFNPVGPVRITLRLEPELLPVVAGLADKPAAIAEALGELSRRGEETPLLRTESWYTLSVAAPVDLPDELAAVGRLDEGYATTWADSDRSLRIPMLVTAAAVLDEFGWEYVEAEDDRALEWRMESPSGTWRCYALEREADDRFAVYSVLDSAVPPERRREGAELVARVNHGLPVGNWEIDMDNGTLRYKTSIDVEGDRLSAPLAARLIERNLEAVDAYLPALTAFADGRATMGTAMAMTES